MLIETVKVVKPGGRLGYHIRNLTDVTPDDELFGIEPKAEKEKALTVEELRAALTELGVEISDGAKKAELKALHEQATAPKPE